MTTAELIARYPAPWDIKTSLEFVAVYAAGSIEPFLIFRRGSETVDWRASEDALRALGAMVNEGVVAKADVVTKTTELSTTKAELDIVREDLAALLKAQETKP